MDADKVENWPLGRAVAMAHRHIDFAKRMKR
jgi:hypothetical protein